MVSIFSLSWEIKHLDLRAQDRTVLDYRKKEQQGITTTEFSAIIPSDLQGTGTVPCITILSLEGKEKNKSVWKDQIIKK